MLPGAGLPQSGRRPLLVGCDVYRPAAIEQLKVVGEQAGVPSLRWAPKKPELIAQKAMAYAKDHGNDIVILYTAGRLQIDDQLMDELVRIKQAVEVDENSAGGGCHGWPGCCECCQDFQ